MDTEEIGSDHSSTEEQQHGIVISTATVTLLVPFFGYVMSFIGAFLCISASIVIPSLYYLKINKASFRRLDIEQSIHSHNDTKGLLLEQ
ncbi:hypothetical protein BUALT_Bualt17G0072000 [Buddleja alternifolia]|uniref:Amino acid transporter transmembrane domain-containing protein n=1 Tax=Buddleja alternifolia TaxID=168488 RepID=A0AAV6W890_9LAMI|nr:hypothetical protein BUALT_Bualt17G0072000 [Buddleja alternifolia]